MHELWSLGLGEPRLLSALHGVGSAELLDDVVAAMQRREAESTGVAEVALGGAEQPRGLTQGVGVAWEMRGLATASSLYASAVSYTHLTLPTTPYV